ncbi:MAG: DUF3343 domain-containing protein [Tissierellia bacterium]|nr:DUF3343 domain-containing protein [Tissierellia bacterium]
MRAVFLYDVLSEVLAFESTLKKRNIPVELIPTPRCFTSNCGLCALVSPEDVEEIKGLEIPPHYQLEEFKME